MATTTKKRLKPDTLVGNAEIAEQCGVTPAHVGGWRRRAGKDFPRPRYELKMGPVWLWGEVEPWLLANQKLGPPMIEMIRLQLMQMSDDEIKGLAELTYKEGVRRGFGQYWNE